MIFLSDRSSFQRLPGSPEPALNKFLRFRYAVSGAIRRLFVPLTAISERFNITFLSYFSFSEFFYITFLLYFSVRSCFIVSFQCIMAQDVGFGVFLYSGPVRGPLRDAVFTPEAGNGGAYCLNRTIMQKRRNPL